jgi:hypothetical protein
MCKKEECCGQQGLCIHEKRMMGGIAVFALSAIAYAVIGIFKL